MYIIAKLPQQRQHQTQSLQCQFTNNFLLAIGNGKIPPIQPQVMPPVVNAQDWSEILPNKEELGDRLGTSNETGEISPNHPHEVSRDKDNYFTLPF